MSAGGVRVNSRAELEKYLRENPLQLRAARPSPPPRAGHPDFIGPLVAEQHRKHALTFTQDREVSFTIRKEPWERERDARLLGFLGEL